MVPFRSQYCMQFLCIPEEEWFILFADLQKWKLSKWAKLTKIKSKYICNICLSIYIKRDREMAIMRLDLE